MEQIRLSPRLRCIAELVPPGAALADVGTDHGLLPLHLLLSGTIVSAWASDIRPGPLSRAEQNRKKYGAETMRCVLCDGLTGVDPGSVDTVVIAGMGGETITAILAASPWAYRDRTLILQPMTKPEILRAALSEHGMRIYAERLVEDAGKLYAVLCARPGEPEALSEAELYIGSERLVTQNALFPAAAGEWKAKLETALRGLASSERDGAADRRRHLETVYRQLKEMEERYAHRI